MAKKKEADRKRTTAKRGAEEGRAGRTGTERNPPRQTRGRQEQEEERPRGSRRGEERGEWRADEASLQRGQERGAWRGDEGGLGKRELRTAERGEGRRGEEREREGDGGGRRVERGMQRGDGGGRERSMQRGDGGGRERGMMMRRRSPFQEIERAFGMPLGLGSRLFGPSLFPGGLAAMSELWPSTDVYREGDELVVKADLPGMKRDDVEVSIENGELVVSGERRQESEIDERDMYRSECSYGSFYRRVPLPEGTDPDEVKAQFRDGVLEVHVPLHEGEGGERGRRVQIR